MWPDRVSNPGPLTYKSGALPIALRGPASQFITRFKFYLRVDKTYSVLLIQHRTILTLMVIKTVSANISNFIKISV